MTDNIWQERCIFNRAPAWHELGIVMDLTNTSVTEAMQLARINYKVLSTPVTGQIETPFGTQLITVPNQNMLVREPVDDDPNYRFYGIVGNRYQIIQNEDIAHILDPITPTFPLETMGALGIGQTVFITFDMGIREIAGEEHHCYLLFREVKDGKSALSICVVWVRVVCQNTLNMAMKSAIIRADIPHMGNLESEVAFRSNLLVQAEKAREVYKDTFEALARVAITSKQAQDVFASAYPLPKKPGRQLFAEEIKALQDDSLLALLDESLEDDVQFKSDLKKALGLRQWAGEQWEKFNDSGTPIAGTAYASVQVVAELEDYRSGAETSPASALWGSRQKAKQRAFDKALELL